MERFWQPNSQHLDGKNLATLELAFGGKVLATQLLDGKVRVVSCNSCKYMSSYKVSTNQIFPMPILKDF